jgi:hypothetical protein
MSSPFLFKITAVIISLATATGVMFHDARVDRLMSVLLSMPITSSYEASPRAISFDELHTHTEQVSLDQTMRDAAQTFGLQPRASEDRKHLLQKHTGRGHHPFDNYNLPLLG